MGSIDDLFPGVRPQRLRYRHPGPKAPEDARSRRRSAYKSLYTLLGKGSATPAAAVDAIDTTYLPHRDAAWWFVRRWNTCLNEYEPDASWTKAFSIDASSLVPTGYTVWDANAVHSVSEPLALDASNVLLNDVVAISASNLLPTGYIDWDGNAYAPITGEVVFGASPSVYARRHAVEEADATEANSDPQSPAFRAFSELRAWLILTADEAATLIGVGRTTPNAWQREGHEPRPRQARRLYELHALVGTLVRRLGLDEMRAWLHQGDPSPWQLMGQEEVGSFADAVESVAMGSPQPPRPLPGSEIADDANALLAPGGTSRRVVVRRRRS